MLVGCMYRARLDWAPFYTYEDGYLHSVGNRLGRGKSFPESFPVLYLGETNVISGGSPFYTHKWLYGDLILYSLRSYEIEWELLG